MMTDLVDLIALVFGIILLAMTGWILFALTVAFFQSNDDDLWGE